MATMDATSGERSFARSLEQRRDALRRANEVRVVRAQMKREVKAGERDPRTLLDHADTGSMKLMDLLLAIPKVGRVKANRMLVSHRISPSKTLGGLSRRQRDDVRYWLDGELARAAERAAAVG